MAGLGLVLSGGGARAAYQAGALLAISEISEDCGVTQPFDFFTGVSAGSINAAVLAASSGGNLLEGSRQLIDLWEKINTDRVYISDPFSLSLGGLRWIMDLSLGGMIRPSPYKSLLDPHPLHDLISENCNFENIRNNISHKKLKALAVSTLDYFTSSTVTFVQGEEDTPMWQRVHRRSEKSTLTTQHLLASSAIPLLFPPVDIDSRFYGDGSIRNHSPCGPAIYMGADRLIAIGVRKKQDLCPTSYRNTDTQTPSVGRVVSVLLYALMMDGLEFDMERLERINANITKLSETERKNLSVRPIKTFWLAPSRDLSDIATQKATQLPGMVRYLLKGLGALHDNSELASFLLFDPTYCSLLAELGYEDALKEKDKILQILES